MFRDFRSYDPGFWGIVFPLGMYASSLDLMSGLPGLHFLVHTVEMAVFAALVCWCLVAIGWLVSDIPGFWRKRRENA